MIGALFVLVIYICVVGLIIWLLRYLVNTLPLDPPFKQVANTVLLVVGILIIILLLLGALGLVDTGVRPIIRIG